MPLPSMRPVVAGKNYERKAQDHPASARVMIGSGANKHHLSIMKIRMFNGFGPTTSGMNGDMV